MVQEFKTRASLSNETLLNMGYTEEEITTIKALANQPELTEEDIMTSSLEATLTLTLTDVYTNPRYFAYTFTYRWSKVPVFRGTDVIAVTWAGCTSTGSHTTIAIDESYSYMDIRYYNYYYDSNFDVRYNWYPVNEYSAVKLEFSCLFSQLSFIFGRSSPSTSMYFALFPYFFPCAETIREKVFFSS